MIQKRQTLTQWSPGFPMHHNFLVKTLTVRTQVWEFTFLSSSQVKPTLLVWGPSVESHSVYWNHSFYSASLGVADGFPGFRCALELGLSPHLEPLPPSSFACLPCIGIVSQDRLCFSYLVRVLYSLSPHLLQGKDRWTVLWSTKGASPSCLLLFLK